MTREGLVLIDFSGWHETSKAEAVSDNDVDAIVETDERRVAVGNAFLACLHPRPYWPSKKIGHRAQVITPAEVVHVTDIGLPDGTVFLRRKAADRARVRDAGRRSARRRESTRAFIVERATLDLRRPGSSTKPSRARAPSTGREPPPSCCARPRPPRTRSMGSP